MDDYEDVSYLVIERGGGGFSAFLWGAMLGAGVALLLAPRSGEETQEELRRQLGQLREKAEGRVSEARDTMSGAVTRTRNQFYDRIDAVRDSIDAGKEAAREARAELERRVSEAKHGARAEAEADEVAEAGVEEAEGRPDRG